MIDKISKAIDKFLIKISDFMLGKRLGKIEEKCYNCNGDGEFEYSTQDGYMYDACPACNGRGLIYKDSDKEKQ